MSYPKSPAEFVARAVAAHEAGFATLTAKKDALADLSKAFNMMTGAIQQRALDKSGPERKFTPELEAVYWGLPDTLNNWRPKHAALVLKVFPEVAAGLAEIDKLVELRAKLNAAEVAPKAPTKAEREEKIRLSATGKVYATEFGKLAPELEKDFERYIEGRFKALADRYGLKMVELLGASYAYRGYQQILPEGVRADDVKTYRQLVYRFLTAASLQGHAAPQLDRARLDKEAKAYAKQQIDQFVVKLTQKLGDLTDVRIRSVNAHGFECVIEGSLRGRRVRVDQTAKFVVNQHGTAFHQFPALIYVDGKFTTEAAYKRLAAGA